MVDIEIKDTGSAPKALGLELAFDNVWADKIRKAAYMSVNDNCSSVQLTHLEYGIVTVFVPPAKLEETSMIIHYHSLSF